MDYALIKDCFAIRSTPRSFYLFLRYVTVAFEATKSCVIMLIGRTIMDVTGRFISDKKVYIYLICRHLKDFKVDTSMIHDHMIILLEFLI